MRDLFLVDILLHGPCNFDCYYCCADPKPYRKRVRDNEFGRLSTKRGVKELMRFLDELGPCEVSLCGTGEAALFPNFFDLCEAITERNFLTLITNMSFDDAEFLRRVPPDRVSGILMSLHPIHEKDLDGFVGRVALYMSKGYPVAVIYVAHPRRIRNIPRLHRIFDGMGVELRVAPFNGRYRGRDYPAGYTKGERRTILSHNGRPSIHYRMTKGLRLHRGKMCEAGCRRVDIDDRTGDVLRCSDGWTVLGNLYKGRIQILERPVPCDALVCGCHAHAAEERAVERYLRRNTKANGVPRVFTKRDFGWYSKLCRPIWREYERFVPELIRLGVKGMPAALRRKAKA
jgi:hypothetical protein